jgi:hypothetical protein
MNERIKELAQQCRETVPSTEFTGETWTCFDEEKFAKLIIQECSNVVFYGDPDETSRLKIGREILKHFNI